MIGRLWRGHRWLFLGFCLALALTLFFGIRAAIFSIYWMDPDHRDEAIAGWMTPRYVAHSWQVPPEVVGDALSLSQDGTGRRVTIEEIARSRGVPVEEVAAELTQAIEAFRAGR